MPVNKGVESCLIGFSGGVDSSVSALLLKNQGYNVVGAFLKVPFAESEQALEDARAAADRIGISLEVIEPNREFLESVVSPFCRSYLEGKTPNPCILCNPTVKFPQLIAAAEHLGIQRIATGHYAGIEWDEQTKLYRLRRARSRARDQSYVLYRLPQAILSRLLLPLADLGKDEVRDLAQEYGLSNAKKADSQEICFIPDNDHASFVARFSGQNFRPGRFCSAADGSVLGEHKGLPRYTIGQRKGLGIALGKPAFVTALDPATNTVFLGENSDLFRRTLYLSDCVYPSMSAEDCIASFPASVKIRSAAPDAPAKVTPLGQGRALVELEMPQRAPAPGQSCVFYRDEICLGGGIIDKTE